MVRVGWREDTDPRMGMGTNLEQQKHIGRDGLKEGPERFWGCQREEKGTGLKMDGKGDGAKNHTCRVPGSLKGLPARLDPHISGP